MFGFYNRLLKKAPFFTQSLTTSLLFASGDLIAQKVVERNETLDIRRMGTLAAFGGGVAGPAMVSWYRLLQRVQLSTPVKTLLARVAVDQCLFAPSFIAIFFAFNGFMDRCSMEEIYSRLLTGYPSALAGNYMIWPVGRSLF
jgi:protein Mpv17